MSSAAAVFVARASRRPTSQLAPHIELFSRVRLVGVVGANLDVLTQAQCLEAYPRFREDLAAFAAAGWAVELLDGLSEDGEAAPDAYAALVAFLGALNQRAAEPGTAAVRPGPFLAGRARLRAGTVAVHRLQPHD